MYGTHNPNKDNHPNNHASSYDSASTDTGGNGQPPKVQTRNGQTRKVQTRNGVNNSAGTVRGPYSQSAPELPEESYVNPSITDASQQAPSAPAPQPKKRPAKRKSAKGVSPAESTFQPRLPLSGPEDTWGTEHEIPLPKGADDAGIQSADEPNEAQLLSELGLDDANLDSDSLLVNGVEQDQSMTHAEQVWRNTLSELAMNMPPATFDTWMRDTQVIGYEDGEFIIGVPNAYACDWIKNKLRTQIKRTLARLQNRSVQVTVRVYTPPVEEQNSSEPLYALDSNSCHSASEQWPAAHETSHLNRENNVNSNGNGREAPELNASTQNRISESDGSESSGQLGDDGAIGNAHINSTFSENEFHSNGNVPNNSTGHNSTGHNSTGHNSTGHNSMGNRPSSNNGHDDSKYGRSASIKLNAYHTFDTFVVGNHNRMAHAAAEAISDKPGASFNPLFVYGGVGLGKTHLLHAIGNRARQNGFNILYCTSEQFTNELILAIRGQSTELFRNKYRHVDILLIDDIQFIGGKESTQEEFFHTFNHLHAAGKQVILSSDRPPKALPTLEERLRSRFEGGLQTDISKPDFETRVAILQSKAATIGMDVEPAALMLLAERVDSNIRELEGALNRIALQAKLFSNRLDVALTESVLKNLAPERTLRTPAAIIETVSEHFNLTVEDLKSRSRTKDIAHARQIAMYLLREENGMSLPSIGDHLGGRDHSTVRHGVEKISQDIDNVESVRQHIMTLREKIYAAPGF